MRIFATTSSDLGDGRSFRAGRIDSCIGVLATFIPFIYRSMPTAPAGGCISPARPWASRQSFTACRRSTSGGFSRASSPGMHSPGSGITSSRRTGPRRSPTLVQLPWRLGDVARYADGTDQALMKHYSFTALLYSELAWLTVLAAALAVV